MVTHESTVTVRYRVSQIGESSMTTAFEVHTGTGLAAEGEVVHAMLDESDERRPVPDAWRDRIRSFETVPVEGV